MDTRTIRKINTPEMKCVKRMTSHSSRDKLRNDTLRKELGIKPAIEFVKKQQINWFGHITRQKELGITQRAINKRYENQRPKGRP
jgi:hypothetical protein